MLAVYQELVGEMARRGIKKSDMAMALGVTPRTLYSKLKGKSDFTLSEANTIHAVFFSDKDKDELFARVDPGA